MIKDALLMAALGLSFATFVTAHLALALGLSLRSPRLRGALALVLPPLAPYWGLRAGMRRRAAAWLAGLLVYAVARGLAGAS